MNKAIGILGDIGSGKSFVAKNFGYPVFNADKEVIKIYKENKSCFKKLKNKLPKYIKSYPINKVELSKAILANKYNLKKIEQETNSYYNSVLMNFYRTGNDSMGWHSDDENIYNPNAPIASLSLGGSRWMKFKKKTKKGLGKKTLKLRLKTGDLILMKPPTQEMLKHSIPKSSEMLIELPNCTFRF